jgi:hypothetical protein
MMVENFTSRVEFDCALICSRLENWGFLSLGGDQQVDGACERIGKIQFERFFDPLRTQQVRWEVWFDHAEKNRLRLFKRFISGK